MPWGFSRGSGGIFFEAIAGAGTRGRMGGRTEGRGGSRAKHRTKREIARLVRELDPLPEVPARMEPLGPVVKGVGRVSHEKTMLALYPVRHLPPGDAS